MRIKEFCLIKFHCPIEEATWPAGRRTENEALSAIEPSVCSNLLLRFEDWTYLAVRRPYLQYCAQSAFNIQKFRTSFDSKVKCWRFDGRIRKMVGTVSVSPGKFPMKIRMKIDLN